MSGPSPAPWRIGVLLGVQLLGVVLYLDAVGHPLIWDDHLLENPAAFTSDCRNLREVLDPRNLVEVLPVRNSARPAWLASVTADACLYQRLGAAGYHLSSVLWNGWAAILLMAAAWRLTRDRWIAIMSGVLFAAHPVHTESVNIVTFRSDILAMSGMALGLCLWLEARQKPRAALYRLGSVACFAFALLSKEMAATFPLLVVLTDFCVPESAKRRFRPRWYAALLVVLALYLVFRTPRSGYAMEGYQDMFTDIQQSHGELFAKTAPTKRADVAVAPRQRRDLPPWGDEIYASPRVRFLTMSRVMGSYLRLLVWPHPLQGDYAPRPAESADLDVLLSWLCWLALIAAAWRLRSRMPAVSFGLLWIPVTLLPVSGLVALQNPQAERYLYIPSAGLCLAAAALLSELARRRGSWSRPAAAAIFGTAATALCALTIARNQDYQDDFSFYNATNAIDPGVPRVHQNLALSYLYANQPEKAEAEFRRSLALWPRSAKARSQYAEFLLSAGRREEAAAQLRAAVEAAPDNAALRERLAQAEARRAKASR